ncbi:unnamed protein product (macronuclear) [Paramecium tetraurelia]|uniref:Uncharacterized protein n=1 Tax=Paramecium tetraurelia TaxID=5888 RepID=A0DNT7_PARTE|nr:uncharacterized protein GSPATT00018900001 [Paramecium tetraurelia]CAK84704.1 unnamed protein product [Paramecium tetraurelia]|eukprot:XP_001452101.1 hypothetical protein (macronuclear) [Paramecium tetraurelia strain d4-2]
MQSNDIKLKCSVSNHDALVQLVCFEPDCKAFRFFCIQCQKDGIHQNHVQMCFEIPKLFEYAQKVGKECDDLLEIVNKQWKSIKYQFQTLIEGIKKKYIISNTFLIQLNYSQLNQTLEDLINFQSQNSFIKNTIQNTLFDFIEKIEKLEQEIKLHEKPLSFHISKQEIEKSQELFYKGYELYQDNDKYDEAIIILDQAINLNPNNYQAIWCKAASLRMLGQYKKAIIWADKALLLDPKHNFSLYCKAACLRMLDQYEEAIIWANKALAIDSQDCFALSCKGSSLRLLKRFNEAIKVINASLTINPNHFDSLKEKGACLHDEHQYQQAMLFYEQALRIFPGDQWTKDRLDKCLQALKPKQK